MVFFLPKQATSICKNWCFPPQWFCFLTSRPSKLFYIQNNFLLGNLLFSAGTVFVTFFLLPRLVFPFVCLSVRLYVCPFVSLSVCLSVRLSVCPFAVCPFVCLSICLSVSLSVCLSVHLSVCLYVCLYVCLSIRSSVCQLVCLSFYLPIRFSFCISICLSDLFV